MSLAFETATELAGRLRRKEISVRELTDLYIERIERHDGALNAVIVRNFEAARAAADQADEQLARRHEPDRHEDQKEALGLQERHDGRPQGTRVGFGRTDHDPRKHGRGGVQEFGVSLDHARGRRGNATY